MNRQTDDLHCVSSINEACSGSITLITLIDLKWLNSSCVSHKLCCIKSAPTLPNMLHKQSALHVFTLAPDGLNGPCMHAWMLFYLLISQFLLYTKSTLVYTHTHTTQYTVLLNSTKFSRAVNFVDFAVSLQNAKINRQVVMWLNYACNPQILSSMKLKF